MIAQPFSLLKPFAERLSVWISAKDDPPRTDDALATELGVSRSASLDQVHGNRVIVVRDALARSEKADGCITDAKDLLLSVRWADCQNFLVYAPDRNIVGLVHVGWRCLVAGTIPSFFRTLESEWGIDGGDTYVCGGPSLCQECSEFSDPLNELTGINPELVHGKRADLRGWALQQLTEAGVHEDRFQRIIDCTRCRADQYWTYRGGHQEEVRAGRSNALLCILR
ncbi:MAG: polyphenol oxidase family protein [Candidatus Peregrinibacteria bacterium]|nr:polyphenol oxidase family protein [Candidatus Peregrinibacteria bacterium]